MEITPNFCVIDNFSTLKLKFKDLKRKYFISVQKNLKKSIVNPSSWAWTFPIFHSFL